MIRYGLSYRRLTHNTLDIPYSALRLHLSASPRCSLELSSLRSVPFGALFFAHACAAQLQTSNHRAVGCNGNADARKAPCHWRRLHGVIEPVGEAPKRACTGRFTLTPSFCAHAGQKIESPRQTGTQTYRCLCCGGLELRRRRGGPGRTRLSDQPL
jgi:hypothetical protein